VLLRLVLADQVGLRVPAQLPEPVGVGVGAVLFQSVQEVVTPPDGQAPPVVGQGLPVGPAVLVVLTAEVDEELGLGLASEVVANTSTVAMRMEEAIFIYLSR
jgi:hypothetical protein